MHARYAAARDCGALGGSTRRRIESKAPGLAGSRDGRSSGLNSEQSTVTFFTKDGNDTDQFEMRVLGPVDADLHVVWTDEDRTALAASGVPLPKPIRLTRAG